MDADKTQSERFLRRCQAGDEKALEELIRRWEQRLFYYVRRLVASEADAWDVLQQTWIRVIRGITSVRDATKLVPWLYRVARNRAFSHRQSLLARERWIDCDATMEELAGEDAQNSEWPADEVHRGLQRLSAHHREALTLFFLRDLSIDDIAEVLGVAEGTVKSRLFHAKKALREVLERMEQRQ